MELETFRLANDDYLAFDAMMADWNLEYAQEKDAIAVRAYPGGNGSPPLRRYELRNAAARERVFTHVDPRRYDWKRRTKGTKKGRRRLRAKPPVWFYYCGDNASLARNLRDKQLSSAALDWDYKDGFIFPRV